RAGDRAARRPAGRARRRQPLHEARPAGGDAAGAARSRRAAAAAPAPPPLLTAANSIPRWPPRPGLWCRQRMVRERLLQLGRLVVVGLCVGLVLLTLLQPDWKVASSDWTAFATGAALAAGPHPQQLYDRAAHRAGRDGLAGLALGLTLVKPHLMIPLAAALILVRRWRLLLGWVLAGLGLVALVSVRDPGWTAGWAHAASATVGRNGRELDP